MQKDWEIEVDSRGVKIIIRVRAEDVWMRKDAKGKTDNCVLVELEKNGKVIPMQITDTYAKITLRLMGPEKVSHVISSSADTGTMNPQLLDDLRKLYGLTPYNNSANQCYGDNYFSKSIQDKYASEHIKAAMKYLGIE
jgi:hypothetical protein